MQSTINVYHSKNNGKYPTLTELADLVKVPNSKAMAISGKLYIIDEQNNVFSVLFNANPTSIYCLGSTVDSSKTTEFICSVKSVKIARLPA